MSQKMVRSLILLVVVLALCACAGLLSVGANATPLSASPSSPSIVNKLAVGLLKMEEIDLSIDAEQAKVLLPLWKAVKSLGSDRTSSQVELAALYAQIQESLSAEQVQFITQLSLTSSEVSALVQQYAAQPAPENTSSQGVATQTARTSSSASGSGGPGGGPGGDFGPVGGPGGAIPGVTDLGTSSITQTSSQAIAQATAAARNASGVSATTNVQLADPLIKLLEKRMNA